MKKSFLLLTALLAALVLIVSCGEDPFFKDVTFLDEDGKEISSQIVLVGDKATEPEIEIDGYSVKKWQTEDGEEFDFNTPISDHIRLKAFWREIKVGDKGPAGGVVFYDAGSVKTNTYKDKNNKDVEYTWRYLEAAPSETDETYYFGYYYKDNGNLSYCGATAYAIGNGRMTTSLLVNAMGDTARISTKSTETAVYAAKYADDYTYGGFDDWFLPSTHEIRSLINSKTVTPKYQYYMSSTEYGLNPTYKICTNKDGAEDYPDRDFNQAHVWPIRAF